MIGQLKGIVDDIDDDVLILDVGGVGYNVFASLRTIASLEIGATAKLSIEMNVREDHIHLFGFANNLEREWFRLLVTVQRLGNKMALAILGAYTPTQIANAIMAKDMAAFSKISGVGAKLAERIVTELKDKVMKMPTSEFVVATATGNMKKPTATAITNHNDDAISALVNLGYSRSDAYSATLKAMQDAGGDVTLDILIKLSLKELINKN